MSAILHLLATPLSAMSSNTEDVIMDYRGDLILRVGAAHGNETTFKTCSRTLSRASPVFDRMLYGDFSESKANSTTNDGTWSVDLPSDNPAAMKVFLSICHAAFSKVPRVLSVDELYDITVLTNYWDATLMLRPWIVGWMASVEEIISDANTLHPKMLWISWELGRKRTFEVTVDRMLMETEGVWSQISCQLLDVQTPPDIVGKPRHWPDWIIVDTNCQNASTQSEFRPFIRSWTYSAKWLTTSLSSTSDRAGVAMLPGWALTAASP